ncbi:hypothetical protein ACFVTC_20350 [Streptomyces sp. NPDC057950]|uniref:hypothetical protein n=1 Tax=Streptomyces sp. NPDC057950 TaxID=3346288 RepID=UPI0036F1449B
MGEPVRALPHGAAPPSAADPFRQRVELLAARFRTVAAGAGYREALVMVGLTQVAARSAAGKRSWWSA